MGRGPADGNWQREMSDSEGFSVIRPALVSAGTSAASAGDSLNSATQIRLTGATPEAIAGHRGWESAAALQTCVDAWETRLRQLTGKVRQIGQNLDDTVDGYDRAEAQAVADIQTVAAGLDGKR